MLASLSIPLRFAIVISSFAVPFCHPEMFPSCQSNQCLSLSTHAVISSWNNILSLTPYFPWWTQIRVTYESFILTQSHPHRSLPLIHSHPTNTITETNFIKHYFSVSFSQKLRRDPSAYRKSFKAFNFSQSVYTFSVLSTAPHMAVSKSFVGTH